MTRMYDLCQEFSIIQHDGRSVTDYFAAYKELNSNYCRCEEITTERRTCSFGLFRGIMYRYDTVGLQI